MEGLKLRAGVEGFFCIVRSTPSYHIDPQWYFSSDALSDYMRIAVAKRWNSHDLGIKLEAFAIAGCDPMSMLSFSLFLPHHFLMLHLQTYSLTPKRRQDISKEKLDI